MILDVVSQEPIDVTSVKLMDPPRTAVITGTGDADLYVREGNKPTTGSYDCRPYNDGSSESCTLEAPGDFYVSIRGYKASEFDLAITYRTGDAGAPVAGGVDGAPAAPAHLDVSGHVATEAMDFYELDVVAGQGVVVTSTADADIDLYVKMGQKPTTTSYDERAYTTEGNETLKFTPAVNGKLFIGVHGYNASDYTLVTTDG